MERRVSHEAGGLAIEQRADGKGQMLVGYGAVFHRDGEGGTEYRLAEQAVERIAPTAFDAVLSSGADVRGLYNHDPGQVLGRTAAGTMRLKTDARGLRYEIDLPDTQAARDLSALIQRGDISGSSFSFSVSDAGQTWRRDEKRGVAVRTITNVSALVDVGPVTFPAYAGTTAATRCDGDSGEALEQLRRWRERMVSTRLRVIALDTESA